MTSHDAPARRPKGAGFWILIALVCAVAFGFGLKISGWVARHRGVEYAMPARETQTGRYLAARLASNSGALDDALRMNLAALKADPKNKRLMAEVYRNALFAGDAAVLQRLAAQLPAEAEPALPPPFVLAMGDVQKGDYVAAQTHLRALPPKGFSVAFQSLFMAWAQAGAKTLDKPAPIPVFAQSSPELAALLAYHAALIDEYAGYKDAAATEYAKLQALAGTLPNRPMQGLLNYLQRMGRVQEAEAALAAHRVHHPESVLKLETPVPKPLVATPAEGAAELLYSMASIFTSMQAQAEANAHLHLALMLRTDFGAAHTMLGMLYEQSRQFAAARREYAAVAQSDVLYRTAQLRLAMVENAGGDKKSAFAILDQLQKSDANDIIALTTKGDVLRESQDYSGAVSAYTQALARVKTLGPAQWPLLYARGISYERLHQWPKAEADFLKALELQPRNPEVQNYLGYSWLVQNTNQTRAKAMIADALRQQPANPAIIDSMAWALQVEGKSAEALAFAEQALDMMPKDATINEHLGDIYWALGRQAEAQYQWQRALLFKPTEPGQKQAIERKLDHGPEAPKSTKR